jgi:uncharacterized protein YhbP (UPF0306 family)
MDTELKELISDYLASQKLMAVATFADTPWIANVYFVHDKDLCIYFLSKNWREHSKAIEMNNNVSVAIADSHQPIHLPQKGIQLSGKVEKVNLINKVEWMFNMWNKHISNTGGEILDNPKKFIDAGTSSIFKITPTKIKFFNTELWPNEQFKILELN